ncbi:MAG TPA: contractile injection system protein, VgrG/Pvc8 family [Kofleriaceae bacterium]|nr:contractile injection system protein, VgrG/Pvc8 family [Kofleriaceae bacterium]
MIALPRTAPVFFVRAVPPGGAAQRVDLSDRVLSFTYEDSESKADKLVLSVINWDLRNFDDPVWKKGTMLEVSWGYPGNMAPTRQVVVQKVTGFQTLAVEGLAMSILMNKVARCRTFEHAKRSDVARQIAQDNGYGPDRQDIEDTLHVLPCITQARMTDAQLLRRLADREGFEFYVDFDGFHFHQRRLGQRPVRALRWFTPPELGEILSINIHNDVTSAPGAIDVRGRDPIQKRDIAQRGSNERTQREGLAPVIERVDRETGATRLERRNIAESIRSTAETSAPSAKREADARYRRAQHPTVELTVTVLGDPSLLAKTVVELQGISQRLSGKYYIREAKHRLDGPYTVELTCLRDGHSEVGGVTSKAQPNLGKASDADPDALHPLERVDRETGKTRIEYVDRRGRVGKGPS